MAQKRAGAKLTNDEKTALEAEGKNVNQISAMQMSYDNRMENFDRLISFLSSVPQYSPNEQELKIQSLKNFHAIFKAKNAEAITASIQLSNARIARNEVLYKATTGLVDGIHQHQSLHQGPLRDVESLLQANIQTGIQNGKRIIANKLLLTAYSLLRFRFSKLRLSISQLQFGNYHL